MSAVIHGMSHQVIKFMSKPAPVLSVYWIYISRANNDNVAWPSVKRLSVDTGWGTTATSKARQWLVDHQALELVTDYIRPQWRGKTARELARLRNLDKAQYYRPTGYIVIDDKRYDLLYTTRDQESDNPYDPEISDSTPRVISDEVCHHTSCDVNAGVDELDTIEDQLDTIDLVSSNDETPAPKTKRRKRENDPLFDTLKVRVLCLPPDKSVPPDAGSRLGKIKREILAAYPDMTGELLEQIFVWYLPYTPMDGFKILKMIGLYMQQQHGLQTLTDSTPPPIVDDVCGNAGAYLTLDANGHYVRSVEAA